MCINVKYISDILTHLFNGYKILINKNLIHIYESKKFLEQEDKIMALMGRKIAAIRAYVAEGGGADYHDQSEEHWIVKQIATPMSIYPEYKATRTSFGINALKTLVVEVEADNGVTGFGITTGGYPAAWLVMNHLDRFVVGKDASEIEKIWDQMYRASLYYGRKGVVMNAI